MNSVKKILDNELQRFDDSAGKTAVNRMLMRKVLEKKKRQDEKFAFLFQLALFLLLGVFLVFIVQFSDNLGTYQNITTATVLLSALIFGQVCNRLIRWLRY